MKTHRLHRAASLPVLLGLLAASGCSPGGEDPPEEAAQAEVEEKPLERRARFVDKQAAMAENPKLSETTNEINAVDPISAATQGYFTAVNNATIPVLEREVQMFEIENERNPTFDELNARLDNAGLKLMGLKSWQMYAYDADTGKVTILTDPDLEAAAKAD